MGFWEILFDEGEHTCFTTTPYGTEVAPVLDSSFASPNCFLPPNFFSINPLKDSRRDSNVTAFRNILIEMDKGTQEEQLAILVNSKVPYSTITHSAGKSIHAIISLDTPLSSIEEYKALAKRVYDRLGGKEVVDTSVGNPSRLSRAPGAKRGNKIQELLYMSSRIPNSVLYAWLGPEPKKIELEYYEKVKQPRRILSGFTNYFLAFGATEGEWNISLFNAVCDMTRARYEKEEIIEMCEAITGKLDASDRRTINSAIEAASRAMRA